MSESRNENILLQVSANLGAAWPVDGRFPQVMARDEHRVVAGLEQVAFLVEHVAEFRRLLVLVPARRARQRELRPDLHYSSRERDLLLGPARPFSEREELGEERVAERVDEIVAVVAAAKLWADVRQAAVKLRVVEHLRSRVKLVQEHVLQFAVVLHAIDDPVEKLIGH